MKIYFAHPVATIGSVEEEAILKKLSEMGEVINPFTLEKATSVENRAKKSGWYEELSEELVWVEKEAISSCNLVVIWLKFPNMCIGALCEMNYTFYRTGASISIIYDGEVEMHPWIPQYAENIYLSVKDFLEDYPCIDVFKEGKK